MLESGEYASLTELAAAERINLSYMSRVLRLTLLAPEIVDAILAGQRAKDVALVQRPASIPIEWEQQVSLSR